MSQHAQAAPLVARLVPPERVARLVEVMTDEKRLVHATWSVASGDARDPKPGESGVGGVYLFAGPPPPWWDVESQIVRAQPFFRYVVHDALAAAGRADLIASQCLDWKDLFKIVEAKEKRVLEEEQKTLKDRIIGDGIAKTIKWANREKRDAKNELKNKREALGELKTRLASLPEVDEKIAKEHAEERDKINHELGMAQERNARIEEWEHKAAMFLNELGSAQGAETSAKMRRDEFELETKGFDLEASQKELAETKDALDYHYAHQATLKAWLFVHVPLTYGLLIVAAAHLVLAYAFTGGVS